MHRRYTRAQKRQIAQNLFQRRNFQNFVKHYQKEESTTPSEWQIIHSEMLSWVKDQIDEGLNEKDFYNLLESYGWILDYQKVEEQGLLENYVPELEDIYEDIFFEEQMSKELGPEIRELEKECA